jgi:hypothetical protein
MMRVSDPDELKKQLQKIIDVLNGDKWLDAWWRLKDSSENIIQNNQVSLNEELVDINEWNKALEDKIEIEIKEVED